MGVTRSSGETEESFSLLFCARVYLPNGGTSTVSVIDARTLRVIGRVPVGRGIAVSR